MGKEISRKPNIGVTMKDGDPYPRIYDVETGNELKGVLSAEWVCDSNNHFRGELTLRVEAALFDIVAPAKALDEDGD
jgi:hypothetical protein